jgi:hypothetical protein
LRTVPVFPFIKAGLIGFSITSKKAHATIAKDKNFKAAVSIKDYYTNKKIKGIEEAINIGEGHPSVEVDVNDFPACEQGTFVISYPDGYEKPKYHIELH